MRYIMVWLAALAGTSNSGEHAQRTITVPPVRAHHALVYHEGDGRVLLTGGSTPVNGGRSFLFYNDVWAFAGKGWRLLGKSGPEQSGQRLAYDSKRKRILSFGGFSGKANGSLLQLKDGAWRPLQGLPERPTAEGGWIYDRARDRFVLFGGGGTAPGTVHGDTWEYDGASWRKMATPDSPSPRQAFAMVFDEKRGRTLLFGGMTADGQALGDTWAYEAGKWIELPGDGPAPRHSAGMAYDSKRRQMILFGGMSGRTQLQDTWGWNGKGWAKLAETGPPARSMGQLAYDRRRDRTVLFGGRNGFPNGDKNDSWEWDGAAWKRVAAAAAAE